MDGEEDVRDLEALFGRLGVSGQAPPPRSKVLEELNLEGVVKFIKKLQDSDNSEL